MKAASPKSQSEATGGADAEQWGVTEKSGLFSLETKLGMALVVLLAAVLGFMVYRRLPGRNPTAPDSQIVREDPGQPQESVAAGATGSQPAPEALADDASLQNTAPGNEQFTASATAADDWSALEQAGQAQSPAEPSGAVDPANPFGNQDDFFAGGQQTEPQPIQQGTTTVAGLGANESAAAPAEATAGGDAANPFFSDNSATDSATAAQTTADAAPQTAAGNAFFFDTDNASADSTNTDIQTADKPSTEAAAFNDPFSGQPQAATPAESTASTPQSTTPVATADPFSAEADHAADTPADNHTFQMAAESPAHTAKAANSGMAASSGSSTVWNAAEAPDAKPVGKPSAQNLFDTDDSESVAAATESADPFAGGTLSKAATAAKAATSQSRRQPGETFDNVAPQTFSAATTAKQVPESRQPSEPAAFLFDEPNVQSVDEYEVAANDSYWGIALKRYGSARYVNALIEHNRGRAADPLKLQPGMKLKTPPGHVLETQYPQMFGPTSRVAAATLKPEVTQVSHALAESRTSVAPAAGDKLPTGFYVGPGGVPMYRIDADDTLTSIAQKHLGRASRWIQLYEMNRSNLQDPHKLKIGTVLRLPADAAREPISPSK